MQALRSLVGNGFVGLWCLILVGCGTAEKLPKSYRCRPTAAPITIDGLLDPDEWDRAKWTDDFVDIQGNVKPLPRFRTRAKMLYDEKYLYVAAYLEEPHVWATLTEHDQIVFHDNDFEIFIDPNGDTEEYYEIEINPLETIFDLFLVKTYINGGPAKHEWDMTGMLSAVQVDGTLNYSHDEDTGWSVEFALPWSTLAEFAHMPTPPNPGDVWRINFSRVQWQHLLDPRGVYEKVPDTPEDNWVWSPQHKINMHLPEHWGYLKFTK